MKLTEPELLNERLERLAMVLDEIMPNCALLVRDALELLKEKEAIQVKDIAEEIIGHKPKVKVGHCPCCGQLLNESSKYCNQCGQAVKWE